MSSGDSLIKELLNMLEEIDLDLYWLLAASSLIVQEIAVKKKLDELGIPYNDDFQVIANSLIDAMERKGEEIPEILISIIRSYRHIRGKLLHSPHKAMIKEEDAIAMLNNTRALIKDLFGKSTTKFNINDYIESINASPELSLKTFMEFNKRTKKEVFQRIIERISEMSPDEVQRSKLFDFIDSVIKAELDESLQIEFFQMLLLKAIRFSSSIYNPAYERLLSIIANLVKLGPIKGFIKSTGHIKSLIGMFEASSSFRIAQINAEILFNLSPLLDSEHLNRIVDASISNEQILYSFGAQRILNKLFDSNKDKIPREKLELWQKKIKEQSAS